MASPDVAAELTRTYQAGQRRISRGLLAELLRLWRATVRLDDFSSFVRFAELAADLVGRRRAESTQVAAHFYELFRASQVVPVQAAALLGAGAGAAPGFAPVTAEPLPESAVAGAMRGAVLAGFVGARRAGQPEAQALNNAFVKASGTATRLAANGGRDTILASVRADSEALGWMRVTDGDPCHFCLTLASRGPEYKSRATASFQAHDHCVPAGTLVRGPSTELGFRRWYEGELVIIGLADGGELAITPNHPVLTDRGWVDAGLLREGENVFQGSGLDLDALEVPHEHDVPTPIEDVWGARGMDRLRRVPVAAEDFHGDGIGSKGDVDVVAAHGFLADVPDAALGEPLAEQFGPGAWAPSVLDAFPGERDLGLVFLGVGASAPGCTCGSGDLGAALWGQGGDVEPARLARSAARHPGLAKPPAYDGAGHSVPIGERLLRGAVQVGVDHSPRRVDSVVRGASTARTRFDPTLAEGETDLLRVQADLGRRLRERLAGGIKPCRVVDLRRIGSWSGHVYNLQTAEGWYEANSLIVSNCSCVAVPVYRGTPIPASTRRAEEIYVAAQRWARANPDLAAKGTKNDALNNVRRYLEHRREGSRASHSAA